MNVSEIIKNEDGTKKIYILFSEENKSAEGIYPDCHIIKNNGFTQQEVHDLEEYMRSDSDTIKELAKSVNLWKAFTGMNAIK